MRGPIDYIIVGFEEEGKFDGSILNSLVEPIESGVIKLVALSFVSKDQEGTVTSIDVTEMGDDVLVEFSQKYQTENDSVTAEDLAEVGDILEDGASAGLLVVEQLWAKPLKKALLDAKGFLVAEGRIHPEAALELEDEEQDNNEEEA